MRVVVGEEKLLILGGLQPFMLSAQSSPGVLVVQAFTNPPGYTRPPKNSYPGYPATFRSTDFGETWQPWFPSKAQSIGPVFEGCATQLKDGATLILEWIAEGPQSNGEFVGRIWESRDIWKTLAGPFDARIALPEAKGGYDDGGKPYGGVNLHRSLLEMPNGDLLATGYGWFKGDNTPSPYMATMMKFRSILLRSVDRGRHWSLLSTIAVDPLVGEEGFCEPVLLRLSQGVHKGRLIALLRTGSNKVLTDPKFNFIYQTESDDDGKTWTRPHPVPFQGVDPDLIELHNGVLVAGFGWRTPEAMRSQGQELGPNHGIYIGFSFDQGTTWTRITPVYKGRTTSYLTVREVSPNRLLVVYDKEWWGHKDRGIMGRFIDLER